MSRFLILPLFLGAVACGEEAEVAPYTSDVFWMQIIDEGTVCPDVTIETNYNAMPSDVTSVFDVTRMSTETTGGEYAYVTRGEDGTILFNFRGDVLVGTENENNGQIEVTWLNEESTATTIDLETFDSTLTQEAAVEQTLTLRPTNDAENPTFMGSYSRRDYRLIDLVETDEWDFNALGVGTQYEDTDDFLTWIDGLEPDPGFNGSSQVRNRSFLDDCADADECEFTLTEDCTRQFTVEAIRIDNADIEDFEGLAGFDQPNGVQ